MVLRRTVAAFVLIAILSSVSQTVSAAVVTESTGPNGYGWQQRYTNTAPFVRLTGSSDREYYDWGFKNVSVSARNEQYWSGDCGWWYVTQEETLNITFTDGAGDYIELNTSATTTRGQTGEISYAWNGSDDDPGRWNITIEEGNVTVYFFVYVRGQLSFSSVTASGSPTVGSAVTITAALQDNAGNVISRNEQDNAGANAAPNVTGYASGSGRNYEFTMYDDGATGGDATANDGTWTGQFTPQAHGDYIVTVKASDSHDKWVDGRGDTTVAVAPSGSFPYSFGAGPAALAKIIAMILLGYMLIRPGRRAAALAVLILAGGKAL